MKKFVLLVSLSFVCSVLRAQYSSLTTDVSVLRSFTKGSAFWAIGQTVQGQYHFKEKTTVYALICYYTNGRFKNRLTALATDSTVMPQELAYTSKSTVRFRQVSVGLRHYFKGAYNSESPWSLYSITGFGLLLVRAENAYDRALDTTQYTIPQQAVAGAKNIVRLTADVGMGVETLLGSAIYLYADVRTWIQASRFPSPYLYNNALPRVAIVSAGVRILFD